MSTLYNNAGPIAVCDLFSECGFLTEPRILTAANEVTFTVPVPAPGSFSNDAPSNGQVYTGASKPTLLDRSQNYAASYDLYLDLNDSTPNTLRGSRYVASGHPHRHAGRHTHMVLAGSVSKEHEWDLYWTNFESFIIRDATYTVSPSVTRQANGDAYITYTVARPQCRQQGCYGHLSLQTSPRAATSRAASAPSPSVVAAHYRASSATTTPALTCSARFPQLCKRSFGSTSFKAGVHHCGPRDRLVPVAEALPAPVVSVGPQHPAPTTDTTALVRWSWPGGNTANSSGVSITVRDVLTGTAIWKLLSIWDTACGLNSPD